MTRLIKILFFLLLLPAICLAQSSPGTINARLLDGLGNRLVSSTTTPAGTEQALIVRNIPSGTQAVSGTFWQATQPVSNAGTFAVQAALNAETTKVIGTVNVAASQTIAVTNTGTFAVQSTQSALTSIVTGQQAVTATAAVLPTQAAKNVCIKTLIAGTQAVYYGPAGVTISTGQELSAGDASCMALDNVNRIFVIAGGTGSTVAWQALN